MERVIHKNKVLKSKLECSPLLAEILRLQELSEPRLRRMEDEDSRDMVEEIDKGMMGLEASDSAGGD